MFALPGLLAIIFVDYVRPQEYLPFLNDVPLLHVSAALAVVGFVVDLRLGLSRREAAPHLWLVLLLFAWCVITVLLRVPDQVIPRAQALLVPVAIYVVLAHGLQSFRMLQVVGALLLLIAIGLAAIGVHQGTAPHGCHRLAMSAGKLVYLYDGRPCAYGDAWRSTCEDDTAEPGADYVCERVGLFGTQTDHDRVRYRGTLQDPNELSLAIGIAVPFAFAFLDRRRSAARLSVVAATIVLVGLCVYFTQSRGGQLVFLAVLAIYFVRRLGLQRGLAIGAALALPVLLFGGRSGGETSTAERLECWWVGLHLFAAWPVRGVGFAQFTDYHYLTAHNSFVLAAAELGIPGLLLWTSIVYLSFKIPVQALRANLPPVARAWATALLASISGLVVGSFFLSFAYKDVLWIYVGLTGVLYHAIRRHEPGFEVRFGIRDLGVVALVDVALLITLVGYTGVKLGW